MPPTNDAEPERSGDSGHAQTPRWMRTTLRAAAIYNVAWGALTIFYPAWLFALLDLPQPTYPFIWQCVGMIVGVYALGYWVAASDPARHWPIVAVGLLGKIFGPMGYLQGVTLAHTPLGGLPFIHEVPPGFVVTLITNDLIWWVPFAAILYHAFAVNTRGDEADADDPETALADTVTSTGRTIADLSRESPVLLVLLRHGGCTFCKEALADLADKKPELARTNTRPVFVHMSDPERADARLADAGFEDAAHVSDPGKRLYKSLGLRRGTFRQLFGLKVWFRGLAATRRGHLVGGLDGDGLQMPGVFVIEDGRVVRAFRHATAADRPDYAGLACPAETPRPAAPEPAAA